MDKKVDRDSLWQDSPVGPKSSNRLWVTMDEKGTIMLGVRAVEALNYPDWVLLSFDPLNSRISIRPSDRYGKNAYPVLQRSKGRHRLIRANPYTSYLGIQFGMVRAFTEIEFEGERLVLSLGSTVPAGRRKKE